MLLRDYVGKEISVHFGGIILTGTLTGNGFSGIELDVTGGFQGANTTYRYSIPHKNITAWCVKL